MFKKLIFFCFSLILFFGCQQKNQLIIEEYSGLFNQEFTGELAYEITSFVEKYWRVADNTGFNEIIC